MAKTKQARLTGNLFLLSEDQYAFSAAQIQLLQAVEACGSISAAAKQVGISYKTAWDRVDAMNNMSELPLVVRTTGGARGGGTAITDLGRETIRGFVALQEEHENFLQRLGTRLHSIGDIANFIRSESVKTSARNQFRGEVIQVTIGSVNAEVELRIGTDQKLTAIITNDSLQALGLKAGASAIALVKASWVLLSRDTKLQSSARNKLVGTVSRIATGAVNSDITLDLGGGKSISAIITNDSVEHLALKQGDSACAFFKASSVILMGD
ncbi:TOBE domain-containing protein [Microbulbifer taiwanensis]|uniref:TOBE domain-containing protein n=1 Tax=Microbulbifer taiwanensis TaxID=986746 RepID=A0ABW1YSU3_9GAMM|nr:TOBE domain-containing protein [Microbulbifer taiwanensis]